MDVVQVIQSKEISHIHCVTGHVFDVEANKQTNIQATTGKENTLEEASCMVSLVSGSTQKHPSQNNDFSRIIFLLHFHSTFFLFLCAHSSILVVTIFACV